MYPTWGTLVKVTNRQTQQIEGKPPQGSREKNRPMARAKVVDVDYYAFQAILQRATDSGKRIEPVDGESWTTYIKSHGINLVAASAIARQRYESAQPVVVAEGKDTDGLYFIARNEEGALRLVTIE